MLQLFPFLYWLAALTSAVLLIVLWKVGELHLLTFVAALTWFLLAAYFQFFGASPLARALGLGFQTLLAIALTLRWRVNY